VPRLVIFEGADGIGKTTQAELLADKMEAKLLHQPSGEGLVGFIRDEVKHNPSHNMFERQLLHTASHIVDAFVEFDGTDVVMDRSPLSGLVYGGVSGQLSQLQLWLLAHANLNVYEAVLRQKGYQVDLFFIQMTSSLKAEGGDVYEDTISANVIRSGYRDLFRRNKTFFTKSDQIHHLYLTKEWSVQRVHNMVCEVLNV